MRKTLLYSLIFLANGLLNAQQAITNNLSENKASMKKILLASTSTIYGGTYLSYLKEELIHFFEDADEILFIPYARPSGISDDEYNERARTLFASIVF